MIPGSSNDPDKINEWSMMNTYSKDSTQDYTYGLDWTGPPPTDDTILILDDTDPSGLKIKHKKINRRQKDMNKKGDKKQYVIWSDLIIKKMITRKQLHIGDRLKIKVPAIGPSNDMMTESEIVVTKIDFNGNIEYAILPSIHNNTQAQDQKIDIAATRSSMLSVETMLKTVTCIMTYHKPTKHYIKITDTGTVLSYGPSNKSETVNIGKIDLLSKEISREEQIAVLIESKFGTSDVEVVVKTSIDVKEYDPGSVEVSKAMINRLEESLDHPLNRKIKNMVYLYGASGVGKTTIATEYAKSTGREYVKIVITSQTTVDDIDGYFSIVDHVYHRSLVREAVEHGKVLILDELDAGNPNTMLALNKLTDDEIQFPDKLVKPHPDFRVIATGNTLEFSEEYSARNKQDMAMLARFEKIEYKFGESDMIQRFGADNIETIKEMISNISNIKNAVGYHVSSIHDLNPREIQRIAVRNMIKRGVKDEKDNQ
jgi:hypothetical protein